MLEIFFYFNITFLNLNGKIISAEEPIVTAASRAVRYGDGLFETMKYKNGKFILFDEHGARLWKGLQLMQYSIPALLTPDFLKEQTERLLSKNKLKSSRVRWQLFREPGGLYDAKSHKPNFIIEAMPLAEQNGFLNSNGLHIDVYSEAKKMADSFANSKHSNFLPYFMAALFAKENKLNDAIVLNQFDRICDSTHANIFIIKDKKIFTPALTEGCIAGVMRKFLIKELPDLGYEVIQTKIEVADMLQADEIFLSNSIYNIRWVSQFQNKEYSGLETTKIYETLQNRFPEIIC